MVSLSGLGTQGYEVPFQRERIVLLVVETTTDGGILSHDSAVGGPRSPRYALMRGHLAWDLPRWSEERDKRNWI